MVFGSKFNASFVLHVVKRNRSAGEMSEQLLEYMNNNQLDSSTYLNHFHYLS